MTVWLDQITKLKALIGTLGATSGSTSLYISHHQIRLVQIRNMKLVFALFLKLSNSEERLTVRDLRKQGMKKFAASGQRKAFVAFQHCLKRDVDYREKKGTRQLFCPRKNLNVSVHRIWMAIYTAHTLVASWNVNPAMTTGKKTLEEFHVRQRIAGVWT